MGNVILFYLLSAIVFGSFSLCVYCLAVLLSSIIDHVKDKRKRAIEKRIRERQLLQSELSARWIRIFNEKYEEKGELWAYEHLESYGLIEEEEGLRL